MRKIVGIINERPPKEYTKVSPGLSNMLETKINTVTNSGILHNRNL
jgi:hypothetical protein